MAMLRNSNFIKKIGNTFRKKLLDKGKHRDPEEALHEAGVTVIYPTFDEINHGFGPSGPSSVADRSTHYHRESGSDNHETLLLVTLSSRAKHMGKS
jgi:hypothetical protein